MMSKPGPFIIQFNSLEDMINEMAAHSTRVARVWLASWREGTSDPTYKTHAVTVQMRAGRQVFQVALVLGGYSVLYVKPFGPENERKEKIIHEALGEALEKVKAELVKHFPSLDIRPGAIFTGLQGPQITRAGWEGFRDLYDQLKAAGSPQ